MHAQATMTSWRSGTAPTGRDGDGRDGFKICVFFLFWEGEIRKMMENDGVCGKNPFRKGVKKLSNFGGFNKNIPYKTCFLMGRETTSQECS